jgi:hypothetical protein
MKANIYILLLAVTFSIQLKAQSHLVIGTDGNVICNGSPFVILNDLAFNNSGNYESGNSFTQFTGSGFVDQSKIQGGEVSVFADLVISNPANFVQLLNDVEVEGFLLMGGGKVNLMDRVIHLMNPSSELLGETETSRVTSPFNGYLSWNHPLVGIATSNPGNLGAEITTAALPGLTEVRRGHNPHLLDTGWSVGRWYAFYPTNNGSLNATLRLHYLDAEVIGIPEDKLAVWKSTDNGLSWTLVESSSNNPIENWVEVTGEDDLAMYTFGLVAVPPVMPLVQQDQEDIAEASSLIIYPNPVEHTANLYLQVKDAGQYTFEWYNLNGQSVHQVVQDFGTGPNTLETNVSQLPSGTYFVQCKELELANVKMIKIKR